MQKQIYLYNLYNIFMNTVQISLFRAFSLCSDFNIPNVFYEPHKKLLEKKNMKATCIFDFNDIFGLAYFFKRPVEVLFMHGTG